MPGSWRKLERSCPPAGGLRPLSTGQGSFCPQIGAELENMGTTDPSLATPRSGVPQEGSCRVVTTTVESGLLNGMNSWTPSSLEAEVMKACFLVIAVLACALGCGKDNTAQQEKTAQGEKQGVKH